MRLARIISGVVDESQMRTWPPRLAPLDPPETCPYASPHPPTLAVPPKQNQPLHLSPVPSCKGPWQCAPPATAAAPVQIFRQRRAPPASPPRRRSAPAPRPPRAPAPPPRRTRRRGPGCGRRGPAGARRRSRCCYRRRYCRRCCCRRRRWRRRLVVPSSCLLLCACADCSFDPTESRGRPCWSLCEDLICWVDLMEGQMMIGRRQFWGVAGAAPARAAARTVLRNPRRWLGPDKLRNRPRCELKEMIWSLRPL